MVFFQQNGGSYVLVVDAGREAILSVWQWQWGHLLGKVAVSTQNYIMCKKRILKKYFSPDTSRGSNGRGVPSPG